MSEASLASNERRTTRTNATMTLRSEATMFNVFISLNERARRLHYRTSDPASAPGLRILPISIGRPILA